MPNYRRPKVDAATVFFSVALAQRGEDLLVRHIQSLRDALTQVRANRPFAINAWVVLPDHMHAIWTLPAGDSDFSTRWKEIKAHFSKSLGGDRARSASQIEKGEAGVWQRRFWDHHIRDDIDYRTHLHYCWANPVLHGLVGKAVDWPFTSIHRDIRAGRIRADWSGHCPAGRFGE